MQAIENSMERVEIYKKNTAAALFFYMKEIQRCQSAAAATAGILGGGEEEEEGGKIRKTVGGRGFVLALGLKKKKRRAGTVFQY